MTYKRKLLARGYEYMVGWSNKGNLHTLVKNGQAAHCVYIILIWY